MAPFSMPPSFVPNIGPSAMHKEARIKPSTVLQTYGVSLRISSVETLSQLQLEVLIATSCHEAYFREAESERVLPGVSISSLQKPVLWQKSVLHCRHSRRPHAYA
jgi:hypothetical protein